jgi:hypothetical protein
VTIPDFLQQPSDNLCFFAGFIFAVLGLFAPKRFVGIEMDWRPATSGAALFLGIALIAFS